MADSEYVRLSGSERVYGQRHLLQSRLEFLNLVGVFKNYKRLRQEELKLKVSLKSRIGEVLELLKRFDKLLPKTGYKVKAPTGRAKPGRKADLGLREEILEIKEKLMKLREGG